MDTTPFLKVVFPLAQAKPPLPTRSRFTLMVVSFSLAPHLRSLEVFVLCARPCDFFRHLAVVLGWVFGGAADPMFTLGCLPPFGVVCPSFVVLPTRFVSVVFFLTFGDSDHRILHGTRPVAYPL